MNNNPFPIIQDVRELGLMNLKNSVGSWMGYLIQVEPHVNTLEQYYTRDNITIIFSYGVLTERTGLMHLFIALFAPEILSNTPFNYNDSYSFKR